MTDAGRAGRPAPVDRVEDLTPAWLSEALGSEVTDVTAEAIGVGQMGASYRLHLTGPREPATIVAKLAAGEPARRALVREAYRKEVGFYTLLADTVAVRTPGCRYGATAADATVFTLLLDDLAPAEVGDQLAGCTPAEAAAAVVNLAGLHGPRWCDPALTSIEWLPMVDAAGSERLGEIMAVAVETFADRYDGRLEPDDADVLREVAAAMPAWIVARPERFALTHGDYRLDNLLFGPDGVSAVDWQTVTVAPPGRDLAYFIATSLEPDVRVPHEVELVDAYHEALAAHGVDPDRYDRATCEDDYRLGMLQGPLVTVLGCVYAMAEPTPRADAMFLAMCRRSCAAIRDLGPLDLL